MKKKKSIYIFFFLILLNMMIIITIRVSTTPYNIFSFYLSSILDAFSPFFPTEHVHVRVQATPYTEYHIFVLVPIFPCSQLFFVISRWLLSFQNNMDHCFCSFYSFLLLFLLFIQQFFCFFFQLCFHKMFYAWSKIYFNLWKL